MFGDSRLPARFWGKVAINQLTRCWEWTASLIEGYGQFPFGPSRLAHRVAFEALVGSVPVGHTVDHRCRTRRCVNPDHLEAVPQAENIRRGLLPIGNAERARLVTACPKGHQYTDDNTIRERTRVGFARRCRECARIKNANAHRRNPRRDRHRERKTHA